MRNTREHSMDSFRSIIPRKESNSGHIQCLQTARTHIHLQDMVGIKRGAYSLESIRGKSSHGCNLTRFEAAAAVITGFPSRCCGGGPRKFRPRLEENWEGSVRFVRYEFLFCGRIEPPVYAPTFPYLPTCVRTYLLECFVLRMIFGARCHFCMDVEEIFLHRMQDRVA